MQSSDLRGMQLKSRSGTSTNLKKNPLTPEQRLAVIADEDATLVLAGTVARAK
jgi:hypothetical protein